MARTRSGWVFYAFLLLTVTQQSFAQLTVNNTLTPTQLVQNVLMGSGVTASNITFTGDTIAIAEFGGTTNLGIKTGLVMTTGTTTGKNGPQGPNTLGSTGMDNLKKGDPLLDSIAGDSTHNAAVLEFDFVPTGDSINFRYVFGSEEYPEFICQGFNDIFGFFISGANPAGGNYVKKNIAVIPGTSTPVSIASIHPGNSYGCNPTNIAYYTDNIWGKTIQYDGFTIPMRASAAVVCGTTYHIKLAIADALDGYWDSGVFLEAGSFASKSVTLNSKVSFGGNDTTVFEGCGTASIILSRNANSIGQIDSVDYSISGTANLGSDFNIASSNISGSKFFFPIGVDSIKLDLNALQDYVSEGLEYFTLTLKIKQCNTIIQKTVTFYINDVTPLTVKVNNDTTLYCSNQTLTLSAVTSGGIALGKYKFLWSDGSTSQSIIINPTSTCTYSVSVKDTCGLYDAKDSITIVVNYTPLKVAVSKNDTICEHDSTTISATASDGLAGYKYRWLPTNKTTSSIVVKPSITTTYTVTAIDSCGMQESKSITVNVINTKATFAHYFNTNSDIDFINMSSDATKFYWNFGDNTVSGQSNPYHTYTDTGTYKVTLVAINDKGCIDTTENTIIVLPDMFLYYPNCFTPNNNGKNDVFSAKGIGIAKYKMTIFDRWGNLIFTSDDINVGWDGKTKNAKAETDTYICVFDFEDSRENAAQKIGTFLLLR